MSDDPTGEGDSTFSVCDAALEGERDVAPGGSAREGRPTATGLGSPSTSTDATWSRRDDVGSVHLDATDGTTVRITIEVLPPE